MNELLKTGKLSPEEAEVHPQRSVITRAVGTDPEVDVDAFTVDVEDGDVFLLCSDGLTDMVGDADIFELLDRHADDLDRATRALVAAANRGGGEDNVTAVAFRIAADGADTVVLSALAEPDEETLEAVEPAPRRRHDGDPGRPRRGAAARGRAARGGGGRPARARARRPDASGWR